MISKPEWWTYRKFGWGLAPKTWHAWAYIIIFLGVVFGTQGLALRGFIAHEMAFGLTMIATVVVVIDTLHTMFQLPRVHDERQNKHQLIIEKNSSYAAIFALIVLALYDSIQYSLKVMDGYVPTGIELYIPFDWRIGVVLLVMVLAKGMTSYYVEKRM